MLGGQGRRPFIFVLLCGVSEPTCLEGFSGGGPGSDSVHAVTETPPIVGILATFHPLPYHASAPITSEPEFPVGRGNGLLTEMSDAPTNRKFARTCDTCKARKVRCSGKLPYRGAHRHHENKKKWLIVAARRLSWALPELPRRPLEASLSPWYPDTLNSAGKIIVTSVL